MSVGARARRRTQLTVGVRVRSLWLVGVLLLLLAVAGFVAFANAPQLRVRSVLVMLPDGAPVTSTAVLAAAAISPDANIVLLGAGAIARRIEALPYVARAYVHRALYPVPLVRLVVTSRAPYACVTTTDGVVTIDPTARVLQAGCASADVPIVDLGDGAAPPPGSRLDAPAATALLADLATISAQFPIRTLRRDRFGGLDAIDAGGVRLRFGDDADLAAKLALVGPIRRATQGRPLVAIDLRAPDTPVVTYP